MNIKITKAKSRKDFQTVAELHALGITEGFLSSLGTSFLTSLYQGIAKAEGSGVLIAHKDGEVLGFAAFTKDVKNCYRQVLKKNWPSLFLGLLPSIFKLTIYKKIVETMLYPFQHRNRSEDCSQQSENTFRPELLSIAVASNTRGMGIGKLLVNALEKEMIQMDLAGYFVVTHGTDERSNKFYQDRGFNLVREFISHGKPMNEYFKELSV